ncbi:STAS domain-containing protein [Streptomyces thermoalcalitolerans]|uniref:Anti-sigma factor antagonist n=1 Tax=Streptomyces thermoalcalitolerans TaxID=65605 RepID=A0ABP4AA32_9ACTN
MPASGGRAVVFKVTDDRLGEWSVLRVAGELDLVTSPVLRQRVHEAVAQGRHHLVLDLSDVFFCDSSGVGVLIAARRLIRSCRGRLRLILPAGGADGTSRGSGGEHGGGAHVNRVLGALGVRRLFDVYEDLATAVAEEPLSA